MTTPEPCEPPSRSPDAADLTLARIATPWAGLNIGASDRSNAEMAQALTAWLQARGLY